MGVVLFFTQGLEMRFQKRPPRTRLVHPAAEPRRFEERRCHTLYTLPFFFNPTTCTAALSLIFYRRKKKKNLIGGKKARTSERYRADSGYASLNFQQLKTSSKDTNNMPQIRLKLQLLAEEPIFNTEKKKMKK